MRRQLFNDVIGINILPGSESPPLLLRLANRQRLSPGAPLCSRDEIESRPFPRFCGAKFDVHARAGLVLENIDI